MVHRFAEHRLEGLRDEPRPGASRRIDDARIEGLIIKTLASLPTDGTRWSSRRMARASGLSVSMVQRIWRAFGLQPHRVETFKLSTDPEFVAKVRDVVGLYMDPPDRAVVLWVDEKRFYAGGRRPEVDKLRLLPLQFAERPDARHRSLQADGYAGYDALYQSGKVIEVACFGHARVNPRIRA